MKLLLDQGTPRSTAELLRNADHDAVHASEIGLAAAADPVIIATAHQQDRTVITLDSDFHAHLALSRQRVPP
jgi:predicted nuclease of predicted toxin-antitoxin system